MENKLSVLETESVSVRNAREVFCIPGPVVAKPYMPEGQYIYCIVVLIVSHTASDDVIVLVRLSTHFSTLISCWFPS